MQLIDSIDLFNKIKEMLSSAEKAVTIITKELGDEIAELLLLKASRGIKVNIITKDTNWADWLESKKNSYGAEEIKNYRKELDDTNDKEKKLKMSEVIIPSILILVSVILSLVFLPLKTSWIPIIVSAGVSGALVYYFNRKIKEYDNKIGILRTLISQRETEIDNIRQEIQKNLTVKVNKKVGFTVVVVDGKGLVTPLRLCNKDNLTELTFYDELNEEKIHDIFTKLVDSSQ